jgi:hypothetical protein
MKELFNNIQKQIGQNFPNLKLIDEDYGQLEASEKDKNTYPLFFPAVLISLPEIRWENLGGGYQRGKATIKVKLAFDCYDDTYYGSGTSDKISERLAFVISIHDVLQGFKSGRCSPLVRKGSSEYSLEHGIKVYETLYECKIFKS